MYGSGLGVTMGAHRLWSHRAFKAKTPLKIFLLWLHTLAGQVNNKYDKKSLKSFLIIEFKKNSSFFRIACMFGYVTIDNITNTQIPTLIHIMLTVVSSSVMLVGLCHVNIQKFLNMARRSICLIWKPMVLLCSKKSKYIHFVDVC